MEKNYDLWKKAVITSLRLKHKLSFTDGSITKPTETKGEYSNEAKA